MSHGREINSHSCQRKGYFKVNFLYNVQQIKFLIRMKNLISSGNTKNYIENYYKMFLFLTSLQYNSHRTMFIA